MTKSLSKQAEAKLKHTANFIRQDIVKMLGQAGSGHTAGSLGMADIFTALYFGILKQRPRSPLWPGRDRLILSNGHIVPVRYAAMARAGYFPITKLKTLRKFGSFLQGHPSVKDFPAIECAGGPLAQGFSVAVGMAIAAKMDKKNYRIYCTVGDGELDEGQCWEALMLAAKYHLNNLTVIIDRNNIQIDGFTTEVLPLEPLADKLKAFNWQVITIDGHNFQQIFSSANQAKKEVKRPTVIIAKTIPGKGVSFMENKFEWHGVAPKPEQVEAALVELQREFRKFK